MLVPRLAVFAALALPLAAPAAVQPAARAASGAYDDDGYWTLADDLQARLDAAWDPAAGYYRAGGAASEPGLNASLLLTHAVAALRDHHGAARNDVRARALALRLVSGPPFVTSPGTGQAHAPGWVSSMTNPRAAQHMVFDAEMVDGLVYAYRARDALALPAATVERIRDAIHATARGAFWRYPAIRLNQINWYALMYAADATVTGDPTLLRDDLAQQLRRFFAGARGTSAHAGNFGAGMRFHYLPERRAAHSMNLDSPEYANIVLSFTRFYGEARRAGMPALPATHRRLLREWIRRAIAGYWTHGGYLNWDTGLGFARWHQTKKLGLAQQALIGIAAEPALAGGAWPGWAKSLLDRSLAFYERTAERNGSLAPPLLFGVHERPQPPADALLAAGRVESNAARAIAAGLGSHAAAAPPALYAFDPDDGRLAVTTPTYNTAVLPVTQGAVPYGGLDLARLYDGRQEVAANVGGTPPDAFGVVIRDAAGRRVLASQTPGQAARRPPLQLTKAPRGAGASATAVGRAYAAPFTDLRATGSVSGRDVTIRVRHRFTPHWIETRWDVSRRSDASLYGADALFPSWGAARVAAILRDGHRIALGTAPVRLSRIARLEVRSEHAGYTIDPLDHPRGAVARLMRVAAQPSDPHPGPTVAIRLAGCGRFSHVALRVRLTPA